MLSTIYFNLDQSKILSSGNGLGMSKICPKGLVRPANGFVMKGKRTKHAEFGYTVTKFISSDARDSSDRYVQRICHIMTLHQTKISVRFVQWKVLNMLKTENRTSPDNERIHRIKNEHKTDKMIFYPLLVR